MFHSYNDFVRTLPNCQGRDRFVWILFVQRTGTEKVKIEIITLGNNKVIIRFEKRSISGGAGGCQVYKQTLLELFEIVKEEADLYESCMANEENQV